MPKTTTSGDAKRGELPSTLRRSDGKARRTFAKAHDSAEEQYGDEQRANRVAWSAVKHSQEKVGDRWDPRATPDRVTAPASVAPAGPPPATVGPGAGRTPTGTPPVGSTRTRPSST